MTALYEDNAFISWENPAEMTKFYEDLTESDVWISGDSADEDGISIAIGNGVGTGQCVLRG